MKIRPIIAIPLLTFLVTQSGLAQSRPPGPGVPQGALGQMMRASMADSTAQGKLKLTPAEQKIFASLDAEMQTAAKKFMPKDFARMTSKQQEDFGKKLLALWTTRNQKLQKALGPKRFSEYKKAYDVEFKKPAFGPGVTSRDPKFKAQMEEQRKRMDIYRKVSDESKKWMLKPEQVEAKALAKIGATTTQRDQILNLERNYQVAIQANSDRMRKAFSGGKMDQKAVQAMQEKSNREWQALSKLRQDNEKAKKKILGDQKYLAFTKERSAIQRSQNDRMQKMIAAEEKKAGLKPMNFGGPRPGPGGPRP